MKKLMFFALLCLYSVISDAKNIPVLCLAGADTEKQGLDSISSKALTAYREKGYDLDFAYYQKITPERLFNYPLVIGMIGQLHSGTNPISPALAKAIDRYVSGGGAFLLIPGPSYYTALDFCNKFNGFISKYGAKLLPEIPHDPANEQVLQRVLAYRYLRAGKLNKKHPVTRNLDAVWLPLDFSDNYLRTHTMEISPEWETLVAGNITTVSYPFASLQKGNRSPGRYRSNPPFLAVRNYGKGKIAVFSTASRYFIFDAYHWSHGGGFVMKNGGLQLMTQLFSYLCSGSFKYKAREKKQAKTAVEGNVAVFPDKNQWLDHVCKKLKPAKFKVKYYVDCGSIYDRAYSPKRKYGYVDTPYTNWFVRWAWSEIFHATAANSRAMDLKKLQYRFDGLSKEKTLKLGIMVWAYQKEGDKDLLVSSAAGKFKHRLQLPRFADNQGPLFKIIDIPAEAVRNSSLTLNFTCAEIEKSKFSSVCEIWLFEQAAAADDNSKSIQAAFESPMEKFREFKPQLKYFRGLIGAKSNYSNGHSTVGEMVEAAKDAGLNFLVFTDDAKTLTKQKLEALRYECAAHSDADFLAVAGFSFTDSYKNLKFAADNPQTFGKINACVFQVPASLPASDSYGDPYSLFWKFFGGELTGGKRCAPTLLTPATNGINPFFQRFWRGFSIMSYNSFARLDNAFKLFRDLLASGYGPYPRVCGDYRDSAAITRGAENFHNVILARSLDVLLLYSYSSMISSGPQIKRCNYSFSHLREGEVGGGMLFREKCRILLNLKVEYESPLEEINVYRGKELVRRFYPSGNTFSILEDLLLCSQAEFFVSVKAKDGTRAYTGRFQALDHRFMVGMCADNQNTICNLTRPPSAFKRDEREIYLQHSYWHTGETAGQLGVMIDARKLVPRIIESGIIQLSKHFVPSPQLTFADGSVENHTRAEMRVEHASGDANVISYKFNTPKSRFKSETLISSFRPAPGGATVAMIETTLQPKENIAAKDIKSIRSLSLALMPPLPQNWQYSYIPDKKNDFVSAPFNKIPNGKIMEVKSKTPSAVAIWPNEIGNMFFIPLDRQTRILRFSNMRKVWNGRERLQVYSPARNLKKGEELKLRYLVMLYPDSVKSNSTVAKVAAKFKHVDFELQQGKQEKNSLYAIRAGSQNKAVRGVLKTFNRKNPVPLIVSSLDDSKTSAIMINGKMRVLDSSGGKIYTVIDNSGEFTAGDIFLSDSINLIAEYGGHYNKSVKVKVHNPLPYKLKANLKSNPAFKNLPRFSIDLALSPGESRWIQVKGK